MCTINHLNTNLTEYVDVTVSFSSREATLNLPSGVTANKVINIVSNDNNYKNALAFSVDLDHTDRIEVYKYNAYSLTPIDTAGSYSIRVYYRK